MPTDRIRPYLAAAVYLAICLGTLTYVLVAENGFAVGGAVFVVLALPWTLVLLVLIDLSSVSIGTLNVAFLFAGVAVNAFLLASLFRRREKHERLEPPVG